MPPRCAACPADMYADHALRLAHEIVAENFFLRLLRQDRKRGSKGGVAEQDGLTADGKRVFLVRLRRGKLDKLLVYQIVEGDLPFPFPFKLQNLVKGSIANDALAKGVVPALDIFLIGYLVGHGNSPSLIIVRGGSTPCCRPLIAYQQRRAGLSTAAQYAPFILTVDRLGWICYILSR